MKTDRLCKRDGTGEMDYNHLNIFLRWNWLLVQIFVSFTWFSTNLDCFSQGVHTVKAAVAITFLF